MASWLVGVGSESQVIAVVCGSGIGDVLIEIWLLFVWLDTLCEWRCERGVSVCGEGGGPSTVVVRECCVCNIREAQCGICCHVLCFPGSSIGS